MSDSTLHRFNSWRDVWASGQGREPSQSDGRDGEEADQTADTDEPREATERDDDYIKDLSRKFTNEIGFLTDQARNWYVENGLVSMACENGDQAGYVLWKPNIEKVEGCAAIFQAAVQMDAQRRSHGLSILRHASAKMARAGCNMVQAWCRSELESNGFWQTAGFTPIAVRSGGSQRSTPHILWRKAVGIHAEIWRPPSMRRRGRAGLPCMLTGQESDELLTSADKESLCRTYLQRVSENSSARTEKLCLPLSSPPHGSCPAQLDLF